MMNGCKSKEGIDPSLLFFFLILVMIFCNPGSVGCGKEECCQREEPCMPSCDCC
ncbi:MAG: hypothetical protein RSD88_05670 [Anaerovoracaceae bacterium]